jgi:hypothetical protein
MDYGFGTWEFGEGIFGDVDVVRDIAYRRTIPAQQQIDDEEFANFDLRDTLYALAWMFEEATAKARDFVELTDPIQSRSAQEDGVALDVVSSIATPDGVTRLMVAPGSEEHLLPIFPRSVDGGGTPRLDGWVVMLGGSPYPVVGVDSYARTLDVATSEPIPSSVEARPPDLLTLLGEDIGVLVDEADPPDYTRRALWRAPLLAQLKVTKRLFEVLGRIYGFEVTLRAPYCITEARYDQLLPLHPTEVFKAHHEGETLHFTTRPPLGFRYDQVAADAAPADSGDPFEVATGFGLGGESPEDFRYVQIDYDVWVGLLPGHTRQLEFVDEDGDAFYVEADHIPLEVEVGPFTPAFDDKLIITGAPTGLTGFRPGTMEVDIVDLDTLATVTLTDNGDGTLQDPRTGEPAPGTVTYATGAFSSFTMENYAPNTSFVVRAEGVGIAVQGPKGGGALADPQGDDGALRFVPGLVCGAEYRPAAVYLFDITPGEVLSEPGADLNRLIDRISQKIDRFVPMHIRLVQKTYRLAAQVQGAPFAGVEPTMSVAHYPDAIDLFTGPLFDQVAADAQPADDGAFRVGAELTVED